MGVFCPNSLSIQILYQNAAAEQEVVSQFKAMILSDFFCVLTLHDHCISISFASATILFSLLVRFGDLIEQSALLKIDCPNGDPKQYPFKLKTEFRVNDG